MIEDLSKYQIILLCLLVSFVTSIGSSIITVSLLDTVPTTVTQKIDRVVEHTIETVVPETKYETKEVKTVIRSDEVLQKAIAYVSSNVVYLNEATDKTLIFPVNLDKNIYVYFGTAKVGSIKDVSLRDATSTMEIMKVDTDNGLVFGKVDGLKPDVKFADASTVVMGATVSWMDSENSVYTGIVSKTVFDDSTTTPKTNPEKIFVSSQENSTDGMLYTVYGELIGIKTSKKGEYITYWRLKGIWDSLSAEKIAVDGQ